MTAEETLELYGYPDLATFEAQYGTTIRNAIEALAAVGVEQLLFRGTHRARSIAEGLAFTGEEIAAAQIAADEHKDVTQWPGNTADEGSHGIGRIGSPPGWTLPYV